MNNPKWSSLLLDDHLSKLANEMSLSMILTPRDRLVSVPLDATVANTLERMGNYFDQLPVLSKDKLAGLIFRKDIPDDIADDSPITVFCKSSAELDSIHAIQGLQEAIKHLCDHEACIVFDTSTGEFCGLLHFADLNKQAVRIYCYLWTSALEMSLAELLMANLPDHDDWIGSLSEQRQIQVLGRYEFGRLQKIELSAVEGLELSDLVNIWSNQSDLLDLLGLTKKQFKKRANHLIDLRNRSMHPVRSLVKNHSDVSSLAQQIEDLHYLVSATTSVITAQSQLTVE